MADDGRLHCVVAGGGPAGLMLGVLLARAGLRVRVLEKHADFLRDFRGDTIHPSTLELMNELAWLDDFLELPHQRLAKIRGRVGEREVTIADFSHLPVACRYIAFMPQWDFLSFLAERGRGYPGFELTMKAEVTDLVRRDGRVTGVHASSAGGDLEIHADLVVACDGRDSIVREKAALPAKDLGAPMDVLWFRLPRRPDDAAQTMGRFQAGRIVVLLNRDEYWQCAFVIPKGSRTELEGRGLAEFKRRVAANLPFEAGRVEAITGWDQVKLLTVQVNRLEKWWLPGLLCIGDAAHAMSPVGGVGINLAVQDAVAAANLLAAPLREERVDDAALARVQGRREFPTRMTQALQVIIQNRVISPTLSAADTVTPPFLVRLMQHLPFLQRVPGRIIGLGVRAEHVSEEIRRAGSQ